MFGKSGSKQEAISGKCKNCESFTFCHESDLRIIDDLMLAASIISCILLVIKMFRCVEKCSQIENYPRPTNTGNRIDVLSLSDKVSNQILKTM